MKLKKISSNTRAIISYGHSASKERTISGEEGLYEVEKIMINMHQTITVLSIDLNTKLIKKISILIDICSQFLAFHISCSHYLKKQSELWCNHLADTPFMIYDAIYIVCKA